MVGLLVLSPGTLTAPACYLLIVSAADVSPINYHVSVDRSYRVMSALLKVRVMARENFTMKNMTM